MLDISKCEGTGCPRKQECYRFTKPARSKWQSWVSSPVVKDCKWFWPTSESDTRNYVHSQKA